MQNQQVGREPEIVALATLCKKVNSSFSNRVLDLIRSRDIALLDLSIDPRNYSSPQQFKEDYLICCYLSKWKGFSRWFKVDTKNVAINGWIAAEEQCALTNRRLRNHNFYQYTDSDRDVNHAFRIAREKIYDILGPLNVKNILDECEWTNGATSDTKFGTPLGTKISKPISVTPSALGYLRACVESDPHWSACFIGKLPDGPCSLLNAYKLTESNRFLTVPKSAKTDRVIAAEPAGNIFLQKGVGNYLRGRLARHGIRLSDQSINQNLARCAYSAKLATLDMKAASDTISFEVVRALLPSDWFEFLNSLRCRYTALTRKRSRKLEKFSSMGNGFTFELETLIFYCLSYAATKLAGASCAYVSAYGDDLIVPQAAAERVVSVLEFAGFSINRNKSFLSGDFYESCGKHFFKGFDVTPIYQKEMTYELRERIRMYNRIYRWGYTDGDILWACTTSTLKLLRRLFNINVKEVLNGRCPAIPWNMDHDDGYLVNPVWLRSFDPNRGYLCSILVNRPAIQETRAVDALLAYKLRRPTYSNVDPKGRQFEPRLGATIWVRKTKWIHPWRSFYLSEIEFGSEAEMKHFFNLTGSVRS